MKLTPNQKGFAVAEAALVVIILGIVGFTGYFVYHSRQNVNKTLSDTGNSSAPVTKKAAPAETSFPNKVTAEAGVKVTLSYPNGWSVTRAQQTAQNATKIVSPGGDVYVEVEGLGGLGGACPSDEPAMGILNSVQIVVLNNPKFSLATITATRSNTLIVESGIVLASDTTSYKVGASYCETYLDSVLNEGDLGKINSNDENIFNTQVSIQSKKLNALSEGGQHATDAQIQAFLGSADYKTAVDIIKSFSYE